MKEDAVLDINILYKEYIENKKSIKDISNYLHIAPMTIYDAMIRNGIPLRKSKKFQIPKDILYIEYIENNKTIEKISNIFGCSKSVIQSLLHKYNIETRVGYNINATPIITKDILQKLYIDDNLRIRQVADKLNLSEKHISNKLKEFNIPRKRSEKSNNRINIIGLTFGKLSVVSFIGDTATDGYNWLCKCACGVETEVSARQLLRNDRPTRSCGCSRVAGINWDIIPPYRWNVIVEKARTRVIEFLITREYAEEIFKSQNRCCALSGVELFFDRAKDRTKTTASLDRINSSIGYVEGNVQWVHKILNIAKHITANDEFIGWCKLVAEFNK